MSTLNLYEPINLSVLEQKLAHAPVGHTVYYYGRTTSTMRHAHDQMVAVQRGDSPSASGAIFVAEEQSAGRGRMQRTWVTPYGSALLVSILLAEPHLAAHPHLRQRPQLLPMLAGVAAARTLAALPVAHSVGDAATNTLQRCVALKWPNDLLLALDRGASSSSFGKVAGILLESSFRNNLLDYVVIGIGLNVNQLPEELPPAQPGALPPVSLRSSLGRQVDRTALLVDLCQNLAALLPTAPEAMYREWRGWLSTLGEQVTVRTVDTGVDGASDDDETFAGIAVDVTPDGDLVVENVLQERRHFSAGYVTLRSL